MTRVWYSIVPLSWQQPPLLGNPRGAVIRFVVRAGGCTCSIVKRRETSSTFPEAQTEGHGDGGCGQRVHTSDSGGMSMGCVGGCILSFSTCV